jgi:phytoene dehydrogenase-like protein
VEEARRRLRRDEAPDLRSADDAKQFASHPHGELYGLSHNPARFAARELRVHTPVRGLYLTGADVVTAGVGGALMAGVLTATVITRRNLLTTILRAPATPTVDEPRPSRSDVQGRPRDLDAVQ